MRDRIFTAAIAIPVVLVLMMWPGGIPALALITSALLLGMREFSRMCIRNGVPCRPWWGALMLLFSVIWFQTRFEAPFLPYAAIAVAWTIIVVEMGRPDRKPVAAIGSTLFGFLWLGLAGSMVILLRFRTFEDGFMVWGIESGAWYVLGLLIIVWTLDSVAFFAGRAFGRTKLAPSISPKKTIEGAFAGMLGAALAGLLVAPLMSQPADAGLVLGASIGVTGQVGDLFESAVKREFATKDSGSSLPGHGGWLDRLDSLLFAAVTAALWVMVAG